MIDNVIPYIGGEEEKSEQEPLKIWGTIENGETKTFTLPTAAGQALANGTIKGFMLYAGDGKTLSGKSYSTNYCKVGSNGDAAPKLTMTY